ncbi:MAG: type I methionyl aminopeptidase [Candidatus Shikimatogenerans sp. Tduv]|uniref:Methionine aminopeptidase n=1 Tax=Candidatus Shikimatogenerans sp. Tduv TaxID=3158567 RepID=A0AAU7QTC4_9FLAO
MFNLNKKFFSVYKSAKIASKLLGIISNYIKPGINGLFLEKIANNYIKDNNVKSAFLGYNKYPFNICVSINNEIIHGIPNKKIFKEGDIVTIDCGIIYKKYYSDCAYTFPIGNISLKNKKLLKVTKKSLYKAIKICYNNNYISNIGNIIYKYIKNNKFNVVTNYCGHGIGKKLHKDPNILNYGIKNTGKRLKNNIIISIEPISTVGKPYNYISKNNWTVKTIDKSYSAHFEHNILLINNSYKKLTTYKYINRNVYI